MKIICHLPFPVSTNQIWRGGRGRVFISASYQAWLRQAGLEWMTQKKGQPRGIPGAFKAYIVLLESRQGRDLDNYVKCLLDFAAKMELIKNDKFCRALYVRWGTQVEAPRGCRLVLKAIPPV